MKYSIEVHYTSGDTENLYDIVKTVDIQWDSKEEAQAALQFLKEQWVFYMKQDACYTKARETIIENAKQKEWFDPISPEFSFLVTVDGEKIPVHTPWNGYFETLHKAHVVVVDNPDQIDFDSLDWKKL
jgi:hypothetical protein